MTDDFSHEADTGEQAAFMHDLNELLMRHKPVGIAVGAFFPPTENGGDDDTVIAVFGLPGGDTEAERSRALYTLARIMETLDKRGRMLVERVTDMDTSMVEGASKIIRASESPGGLQ